MIVLALGLPASAQSWQDLASARVVNFDKLLSGTDKLIYVQPPEGKYWVILNGSIALDHSTEATLLVWLEDAPYAPYRDPVTGEMKGCHRCATLLSQPVNRKRFFPIQGQTMPLVIAYPNRLMIGVTPEHGALDAPLQTWTRFQIVEKELH